MSGHMRDWRFIATLLVALFHALRLYAPADVRLKPGEVWIEIPEVQSRVEPNSFVILPARAINYLQLHIGKVAGNVAYGSIHTKINTEAANTIMTLIGTSDGLLGRLDLGKHAGFTLTPGRNSVEVEYKDAYERVHYASFLIQIGGGLPTSRFQVAGAPASLKGERYAVVIGISKYQNAGSGITNLRYADRDAQAFRDFIQSPQGGKLPTDHVMALFNEDATVQNVRSAFYTFLTKARPQDMVVLYLAGHGAPDPNDSRNLYFLTYDTQLNDMGGTAFPMWQLQDVLTRALKTKHVIAFNDSCHAYGVSGERNGIVKQNNLVNQYLEKSVVESGGVIISSSDVSELSQEDEKWGGGHGVFTYYLLKGLEGSGDSNKDGTVTAAEIYGYVERGVREATGGQQNPRAHIPETAQNLSLSGFATPAALHRYPQVIASSTRPH